jgi:hypothetical protein
VLAAGISGRAGAGVGVLTEGAVIAGGGVGVGAVGAAGVAAGGGVGGGAATLGIWPAGGLAGGLVGGGVVGTGTTGGDGSLGLVVTRGGGVGSNQPPMSGTAMTATTARTSRTSTARNQPVAKMLRWPYSSCSSSSRKSSCSGRSGLTR